MLFSTSIFAQAPSSAEFYIEKAQQLKLASNVTWQRLMYVNVSGQSEVTYRPFFYSEHGQTQLKQELDANIAALFYSSRSQSIDSMSLSGTFKMAHRTN